MYLLHGFMLQNTFAAIEMGYGEVSDRWYG